MGLLAVLVLTACGESAPRSVASPPRTPLPTAGVPAPGSGLPLLDELLAAALPRGEDTGLDEELQLNPDQGFDRDLTLSTAPVLQFQPEATPLDPCYPLQQMPLDVPADWRAGRAAVAVVTTEVWTRTHRTSAWRYDQQAGALAVLDRVRQQVPSCADAWAGSEDSRFFRQIEQEQFTDEGAYTKRGLIYSWTMVLAGVPRTLRTAWFVQGNTLLQLTVTVDGPSLLGAADSPEVEIPDADILPFIGDVRGRINSLDRELTVQDAAAVPA